MVVAFIAVPVDVLLISAVALWKSPCMFLETVCVPFAGLAIVLWPLAVIGGLLASFFSSFFFGFRAGLVAYQVCLASVFPLEDARKKEAVVICFEQSCHVCVQEASFQMGLAYMISAVAIFDEYTNDLLYLREGSCLPRYIHISIFMCMDYY